SHTAQRRRGIGHHNAQHRAQISISKFLASTAQMVKVGKDLLSASHVPGGAFQLYGIRFQVNVYVQAALHQQEILIADTKQLLDIRDDFYIFLHSVFAVTLSWRTRCQTPCSRTENIRLLCAWKRRIVGPPE